MRKKRIIILCSIIILAVLIILIKSFVGTHPFKHMKAVEIKNVSVWVIPPDTIIELTEEEIRELVHILHNVKIYNRSWKHMFSGGQSCIFTITYNDGEAIEINAFTPSVIINGKGYRAEYEACDNLNQFANNLIKEPEMTIYEKFNQLDIDSRLIGLEKGDYGEYFCTPVNATIIGWENSIHYCFIEGYGEMVFAVNPESVVDRYVYPLAANFEDFLCLILVSGSTTAIEQIVGWNAEQFGEFVQSDDNKYIPGQAEVLEILQKELNLEPMNGAFEYVKNMQKKFDDSKIIFSNEYYDTLGMERPDGTENEMEYMEFEPVVITGVISERGIQR